jgi:predicted enzyme related to lactoylglutathione lyase
VDVEDVQAALDKAAELGGKTVVGPIAIPSGTFAWFQDPDGNMIGLVKSPKS